ncbi:PF07600 domain protein, partial [Leptospira alstonii serovar Pingchang str. 80-412]
MDLLLLSCEKKIQSSLNEGTVGTDSLLIPMSYWNRLDALQKKALSKKLPFLLKRYTKYVASLDRLHWRAGKIKYNWGVGELKKMTIHVNS